MESIEIHSTDMTEEMQRETLQVAILAVNMYTKGNDIANYIKKEFERKYWDTWECIVGDFVCSVQYTPDSFIRLSVGDRKITLFKTE